MKKCICIECNTEVKKPNKLDRSGDKAAVTHPSWGKMHRRCLDRRLARMGKSQMPPPSVTRPWPS